MTLKTAVLLLLLGLIIGAMLVLIGLAAANLDLDSEEGLPAPPPKRGVEQVHLLPQRGLVL